MTLHIFLILYTFHSQVRHHLQSPSKVQIALESIHVTLCPLSPPSIEFIIIGHLDYYNALFSNLFASSLISFLHQQPFLGIS